MFVDDPTGLIKEFLISKQIFVSKIVRLRHTFTLMIVQSQITVSENLSAKMFSIVLFIFALNILFVPFALSGK